MNRAPLLKAPRLLGALLLPTVLGACTGPMLALDCLSTSLESQGPSYRELDMTLKLRDKNGQVSTQKLQQLCHYTGVICYSSGAVHTWEVLSPASTSEFMTPNGWKIRYAPSCNDLNPGTRGFTDAFYMGLPEGAAADTQIVSPTWEAALATYGIQVVGIQISARSYSVPLMAGTKSWRPLLSWGEEP